MTTDIRPDWYDERLFPYENHVVDIDGARVHYVDEGEGPTLLMLHGNPTWSFLYRDLIAGLRDRFRCVALDYPGFGLSTAPAGYGYTIREHARVVERFVLELDLASFTPVVQDWGGPIGMAVATRHPDRLHSVVLGNTWAWPLEGDRRSEIFSNVLGGRAGEVLVERLDVFTRVFVPGGHRLRRLTRAEKAMYRGPHPTPASREPVRVMPREIVAATPFLAEIRDGLPKIADRRALIVWGTADVAFGEAARHRWEQVFPDHETVLLEGAGHFIQDDAPLPIVVAIRRWFAA